MQKKAILGILLIIVGIILIPSILTLSHSIKYEDSIQLSPGEIYYIGYNGSSEIIFSYNFSSPVIVSGYPSSATTTNDSKIYVICFFSTSPGKIKIYNPNNISAILYYSLYESSGLSLYSEYAFVLVPASIVGGIFLLIYSRIQNNNKNKK
ncbi:hypothetical protein DFR86_10560 [Acidianus sulfidivorans JP7]|uniref:Multipass membrane protein n=1 Tax=Acidianus sulfidivorans JP7 TaxID=619593 RepID=A0A2U9IPK5_9CREN|nr:hypothetical protein [Acidianus sulfidivorans]AWR97933.1 hypothetical protein DFR86_10560 [Acidianus sulfidivorans JP7]